MDNRLVRKRKRLFRFAVDLFVETLQDVTKRRVNYKCNNSDSSSWSYFVNHFGEENIGEDFIRKFLQYGFQSWFNDGTEKDYSRSVRFSWIFGAKAVSRWNKLGTKTNIHLTRVGLKSKHKIKVTYKSEISSTVSRLRDVEENFKKEYHNTKRGFLWCVANTTLYHHKSSLCTKCNWKKDCKQLLKQELPKIYIKRGYVE